MPTYNYKCTNEKCKHEFEIIQKISDDKLIECPECKEPTLQKVLTNGAFQLKGHKWASKSGHY